MGYLSIFALRWENAPKNFSILDVVECLVPPDLPDKPMQVPLTNIFIKPSGNGKFRIERTDGDVSGLTRQELFDLVRIINKEFALSNDEKNRRKFYLDVLTGEAREKWYGHTKEMLKVSRAYPEITFILDVDGDDSMDFSREYFRDGKHKTAKARLVYDEVEI